MNTAEHYDNHLEPIYSWMVGDFDAVLGRSTTELNALRLPHSTQSDVARAHPLTSIDLGAGIGLHALPLARFGIRGYRHRLLRGVIGWVAAACG